MPEMFVCRDCAAMTGWVYHAHVSTGQCELCEQYRDCDDIKGTKPPAKSGSLDQIKRELYERRVKELDQRNWPDGAAATAMRLEKKLCAALGRPWSTTGISVVTLVDDVLAELERLRVYERYIGNDQEAQAEEAIEQKRLTGKYPFED